MTFKEIQELIKLISKTELAEFKMKDGEFELAIRTRHFKKSESQSQLVATTQPLVSMPSVSPPYSPSPAPSPAASKSEAAGESSGQPAKEGENEASENNYKPIKSPMVGTFYRSSSPEKPPYIKVGDTIEVGAVVCIVEAMKLFNEIESEISGKIVKVLVDDAQPVEYDQVLFLVDPKG